MDLSNVTAAGIIIFRNDNNHPVFLGLKALPRFRKKNRGIYDIPKGRIDPGETPIEAAYRECIEESGIVPLRLIAGPFVDGPLALWLGETDEEDILIANNPESGHKEHEGYTWVNPSFLKKNCLDYLKPSITWAEEKVWEYFKL